MTNLRPNPKISAIITTYNRPQLLQKALLSLGTQTLDANDYEVIVVDDGSCEETRQLIDNLSSFLPFKYVRQANSGLASAKNHGLFHASAPIVLFLDDDDLSSPDLLEQHLLAHQHYSDLNFAILGHTRIASHLARDPLMSFVTSEGGHLFSFKTVPEHQLLGYDRFWGGRTSCKRKYLLSHGVFNPIFKFGFEDIELGYRLSRHGLHVVYWKQAVNTMIRRIQIDAFLRRCYLQGQSGYKFLSMYPDDQRLAELLSFSDFPAEWVLLAPNHEDVLAAARHLDALFRDFPSNGEPLLNRDHYYKLTSYAYYRAFRAETIRGYMEAHSQSASNKSLSRPALAS